MNADQTTYGWTTLPDAPEIRVLLLDPESDPMPLYCQYDGASQPQEAYLYLTEAGGLAALYDPSDGSTDAEAHGRTRLWTINGNLGATQVNDLLTRVAPLAARVHAGLDVGWDGRNMVGRLDDDARRASREIERLAEQTFDTETPSYVDTIWDIGYNNLSGSDFDHLIGLDGDALYAACEAEIADVLAHMNDDAPVEVVGDVGTLAEELAEHIMEMRAEGEDDED